MFTQLTPPMESLFQIRFCTLLPVFFLSISVLAAQPAEISELLEGFDEYVEQVRQDWEVPGVAVGIVRGDEMVYAKGYGLRDVNSGLPVTENTLFAIGSTTKAMTAVTVCQLVDDGLIELDEPLIEYLPDFRMYDDYVTHHLTSRDLMCHRSGLPRHDAAWYGSDRSREELFHALRYLEPSRGFREAWQYQNLMFMAAGYLVGQMRGASWEQVIRERLFGPLGMERSSMSVEDSKKDEDHALPYAEIEDEVRPIPFRNIDAVGPAGSVNSSVAEMSRWLIMQLNGGKFEGQQVVSSSMLNQTHTPHMPTPSPPSEEFFYGTYGLGWGITAYRNHLLLTHGGGIDGFITQVALLPKDSIGIVVLTNSSSADIAGTIRNAVMDHMLGLERIDWNQRALDRRAKAEEAQMEEEEETDQIKDTRPSHPLPDYTGRYDHPGYGTIRILMDNEQLRVQYNSFDLPLEHFHYDVFQGEDPRIGKIRLNFHTDASGMIHQLSSKMEPAVDPIVFERTPELSAEARERLQSYTGSYLLQGTEITVSMRGENTLVVTVPGQPPYTLVPRQKDNQFQLEGLPGYWVEFTSEEGTDKVKAVVFHQPNGMFTAERKE